MMVSAVIPAGGKGERMGAGFNKLFLKVGGEEIISRTIAVFDSSPDIDEIIVVAADTDREQICKIIEKKDFQTKIVIAEGGTSRQESVYNGLLKASGDISLIHDGARCLVTHTDIKAVIDGVREYGAAAVGVTVTDTLKHIDDNGNIVSTIDREKTVHIFTPQGFYTNDIIELHNKAKADGIAVTDDCSILESYGRTVRFINGSDENIKVTTPKDIELCEEILRRRNSK